MNAINSAMTALFDALLTPLEAVGPEFALIVVSGIFGILALVVFKQISSQKGIKATKDKIKGHMIEIRLYQNDLGLVSKAIGKVLGRNLQYVAFNFGPILPLIVPFTFLAAQMVVRYGFEPAKVQQGSELLAGEGLTLKVELSPDRKGEASKVEILLPDGVEPVSPLVRVPAEGFAYQEVVATRDGSFDLVIKLGDHQEIKTLWAGDTSPRTLQPERTGSFLYSFLWPAEDSLPSSSGIARVWFVYPESDLGWLPLSGPGGILIWIFVASMLFGVAVLKPLGVTI
jgi:hypothetical protein